jgi:hypothetical protein
MAPQFPGGSNTYVKSLPASNALCIGFSRNPQDFRLNRYVQIKETEKQEGYYLKLSLEMALRIQNVDLADLVWPDGKEAPEGNDGQESFEFLPYKTIRRVSPYTLGDLAVEQADWSVLEQHARIHAQRMMTARTQLAYTLLNTAGNYGSNTIDVDDVPGTTGDLGAATGSNLNIKKCFGYAIRAIEVATGGVVQAKDLVAVMGPGAAAVLAESLELADYLKQSPFAMAQVKGEGENINRQYGLPEQLYGLDLCVENAVKVSSNKSSTAATPGYMWGANQIAIVSRPGGLVNDAPGNTPSFSSVTLFAKEDMTVESKADPDNRRTKGRVVDDVGLVMTAPAASYLLTGVDD